MLRKDIVVTFKDQSSKLHQFDQILHVEIGQENSSDEVFELERVVGGDDLLVDIS